MPAPTTTDELLAELAQVGHQLAQVDDLYARRLDLMVRLRKVDPPITIRRLAEVAGMTEGAATQALRQARDRGML